MSPSGRPGGSLLRCSERVTTSRARPTVSNGRARGRRGARGAVGPPTRFTPNPGRRKGKYGHVDAADAAPLVVAGPYSPLGPPLRPGRSRRAEAVGPSVD